MNPLEHFIHVHHLNEIECMNALQLEGGIISDNCVMVCDVSEQDCAAAKMFLALRKKKNVYPIKSMVP